MFVTRASERAFPPRDFPTVLALSSAVALTEIEQFEDSPMRIVGFH